jgi:hypothetical protein
MRSRKGTDFDMETGRELFNLFLKDQPLSRPPFVPMIRGLLSKVEGLPMETLMNDPTLWANSLVKTYKLFRFDGVVVGLDFTLMAEACGCELVWLDDRPRCSPPKGPPCTNPQETGRMRHAIETAKRVFEVCRQEQACIAAMTGPVTLSGMLFGQEQASAHLNEVKQLVVNVAEAFCRSGPDVLIFLEGRALASEKVSLAHRKIYNTLKNVAGYYNVKTGLYLQGYDPPNVAGFRDLKLDLYVLGPSAEKGMPTVSQVWDLGVGALGVGLGLRLDDLEASRAIIREGLALYRATKGRGLFFTSFGPATREVNLNTLHELVKEIFKL